MSRSPANQKGSVEAHGQVVPPVPSARRARRNDTTSAGTRVEGPLRRLKRSVTLDADVAGAVDKHVARGAAASFSAAINDAATRWAANQDLRAALDALYEEDPSTKPHEDELTQAATQLGRL